MRNFAKLSWDYNLNEQKIGRNNTVTDNGRIYQNWPTRVYVLRKQKIEWIHKKEREHTQTTQQQKLRKQETVTTT